jgi:aspartate aminotransferase-like enzyme
VLLECEENLLSILNAPKASRVLFFTASGTAGMEATVQNLIANDDKTIIINGGEFGQRFVDICNLHNIDNIDFKVKNDALNDTTKLKQYKDAKTLLINAHETTIGLLYDLASIGNFCQENNILNIVDGISLFVTDELDMQKFNIDALILSSQKGLALPPGITMVVLTPKAMESLQPQSSLYFDFTSYLNNGKRGQTPFTPAVTILLQLHFRVQQIVNNGINNEIEKAKDIALYFRESLKNLPLDCYSNFMPNAMTCLTPTNGQSASEIVDDLDKQYNIIVAPNGGELKDKVFRVSHMGAITREYTDVLIDALYDYYKIKRERIV